MTQKRWLILAGAWILVFAGFYLLIWQPNINDIKAVQGKIRIADRQLKQLIRDVETWPSTVTRPKMESYEQRLQYLFSLVPSAEEVPQILDQIEQRGVQEADLKFISLEHDLDASKDELAALRGTTIDSEMSPLQSRKKEFYILTVEGQYANLIQFLHQLEAAPRLINVSEFTIRRIEESDDIEAILMLNIFHTGDPL